MNRWQTAPESVAQTRSKKAEQLSGSLNTVNTVTSGEPSSGFKLKRNKQQRTKYSKNTPLRANGNEPVSLSGGHGVVGAKNPDVLDHHRLDLGGGSLVDRFDHAPIVCKARERCSNALELLSHSPVHKTSLVSSCYCSAATYHCNIRKLSFQPRSTTLHSPKQNVNGDGYVFM